MITAGLVTCSVTTERGDRLKGIDPVDSMPGVLKSLKGSPSNALSASTVKGET